jgi:hypothetical protein
MSVGWGERSCSGGSVRPHGRRAAAVGGVDDQSTPGRGRRSKRSPGPQLFACGLSRLRGSGPGRGPDRDRVGGIGTGPWADRDRAVDGIGTGPWAGLGPGRGRDWDRAVGGSGPGRGYGSGMGVGMSRARAQARGRARRRLCACRPTLPLPPRPVRARTSPRVRRGGLRASAGTGLEEAPGRDRLVGPAAVATTIRPRSARKRMRGASGPPGDHDPPTVAARQRTRGGSGPHGDHDPPRMLRIADDWRILVQEAGVDLGPARGRRRQAARRGSWPGRRATTMRVKRRAKGADASRASERALIARRRKSPCRCGGRGCSGRSGR